MSEQLEPIAGESDPIVILSETDDWLVVAKPPGILVHRHPSYPREYTLYQRLRDQLPYPFWTVHRLDRQASGCLIYGKNKSIVPVLAQALKEGQKTYLALVRGYFKQEGIVKIDKPMKAKGKLREASSEVMCLGRCHEPRSSLLVVWPKTGRFHQVRRHVRDLSHPILHDGDHGDSKVNRWWRANRGLNRLGLHAFAMSIKLSTGENIDITCPLFDDHAKVMMDLPWWEDAVTKEPRLALPPLPVPRLG